MITQSFKKKFLFVSIIIFLAALIPILLVETYIRMTKDYVTPEIIRERSLQYSPALFARHVFPLKEQIIEERGWHINPKGYRGKDFTNKKSAGTKRIIVYGGSAVFDQNVVNKNDWPARIEQLLKENGLANVEVINAGIPGHASFDSFGRLFMEGHTFEPDFVILYNSWNDIKYFPEQRPLLRTYKPYYESKEFRSTYQGFLDQAFCEVSQLYVRLRSRYYTRKFNLGSEGIIQGDEYSREIHDHGPTQFQLNIEMFTDLAHNIGATPILVTQARLVTHNNSEKEKSRIGYHFVRMKHEVLLEAFQRADDIILDVAKSKQVAVIDAAKQMSGKSEYFGDHVHLSDPGSRELAKIISEYLFPRLATPHPNFR